jgi:hypothetical protein
MQPTRHKLPIFEKAGPGGLSSDYRLVDGPFQQWEIWYQQSFLAPSQCDLLVEHFERYKHHTKKSADGRPFFDDRVLWFDHIPQEGRAGKAIMQRARGQMVDIIKRFYKEPSDLFSDTIQLVKWMPGQPMQVHADNVYLEDVVHPTPHRDFAAIVYLNDDFPGGYIYFEELKFVVRPRKGLLLAFPGGIRYRHGVTATASGLRYTMPAWFTRDITKRDPSELEEY